MARSGCLRSAVALPADVSVRDVEVLPVRAHSRPPRRGGRAQPPGAGFARLDRANRLFGLDAEDRPTPSAFHWTGGAFVEPAGRWLELPIQPE